LLSEEREEDLSTTRTRLSTELKKIEDAAPSWIVDPPDPDSLRAQIAALRSARDEDIRVKQARASREARLYAEIQASRQQAEEALNSNRNQLQDAERRLRVLAEDGKSPAQRQQELERIARERDQSEQRLQAAKLRLAAMPSDARKTLREIELQKKAAELRLAQAGRDAVDAEATQRALLLQGPYAALAEGEEEIERLTRECAREMLRLNSIRRLWETFEAQKTLAFTGIAEPVSQRATEILAEIMGRRHADLTLSNDFSSTTIRPVAAGCEVKETEMSGGEKEQIALSVRLALAEHLTAVERHLVVLDDVLLNTDDQTLARILNFLEQRKERFQIAILTCHAERYRGLRGVRKIAFPPVAMPIAVGA
jgi:uncharacterized protein YhaN